MADNKRAPLVKLMTPKGVAKFPNLNKPDTKFNPDGEFKVGVILSGEESAKFRMQIDQEADKALANAKAELEEKVANEKGEKKAKAKKALDELAMADMPYKPVYDEDGNETGDFVLQFKMKAQRKDKKTGQVTKMFPKLFDAAGKQIPQSKDIWGGSLIKVAGLINPFYIPGTNMAGVSLRLSAVQVIELRSSGGGDASSYGFGKEDGYNTEDDSTPPDFQEDTPPEGEDEF